jgi:hypothetical protein
MCNDAGLEVEVNWYYEVEDEDIFDTGVDYQNLYRNFKFNFFEIE